MRSLPPPDDDECDDSLVVWEVLSDLIDKVDPPTAVTEAARHMTRSTTGTKQSPSLPAPFSNSVKDCELSPSPKAPSRKRKVVESAEKQTANVKQHLEWVSTFTSSLNKLDDRMTGVTSNIHETIQAEVANAMKKQNEAFTLQCNRMRSEYQDMKQTVQELGGQLETIKTEFRALSAELNEKGQSQEGVSVDDITRNIDALQLRTDLKIMNIFESLRVSIEEIKSTPARPESTRPPSQVPGAKQVPPKPAPRSLPSLAGSSGSLSNVPRISTGAPPTPCQQSLPQPQPPAAPHPPAAPRQNPTPRYTSPPNGQKAFIMP